MRRLLGTQDRASYLMDLVVAQPEQYTWSSCREQLAAYYMEVGRGDKSAKRQLTTVVWSREGLHSQVLVASYGQKGLLHTRLHIV